MLESPLWLLPLWFWPASLSPGALWSYGSAFVVLAGVVGETVAELTEWIKPESARKKVAKISAIVLILGLTGDLLGIRETQIEVAALNRKAGDAKKSAEDAASAADHATKSADAAKQRADAVENQADALRLRLGRASGKLDAIEQDILAQGPRWRLLERGKDVFIKALKPFAGQRVTVVVCGNDDDERFQLEQLIMNMFSEAGWDSPGYARWAGCPNIVPGGNEIFFVAATDDSAEWAGMPAQQWLKQEGGRFNVSHDAVNTLCDVLYKLRIFTLAWREKPLPVEVGIQHARRFFGFNAPGGPAEMAYKDPGRIFLLIRPSTPMFAAKNNHPPKSPSPK